MKIIYDGVGDTLSILISGKQMVCAEEHGAVVLNCGKDGEMGVPRVKSSSIYSDLVYYTIRKFI